MRFTSLLILTLLIGPLVITARAAQYSPGVQTGDWTRYQISGDLSENVTMSSLNITQVSGSNVTVKSTDTYKDGTVSSEFLWVDLSTGQNSTLQSHEPGFFFDILPGRGVGQSVYGPSSSLQIQQSFVKQYAQADRQTNFANVTLAGTESIAYYWDAQTGIFTEILNSNTTNRQVAVHAVLNATNIWSRGLQDNSPTLIAGVAGIGIVAALALLLGYLRVTKKRRDRMAKS